MSAENVEIIRRTYEAFDRGDLAAILEEVHPDVVSWAHPRGESGRYEGKEGVLEFISDWIESFEDFSLVVEEYTDAGDDVLVRTLQHGRGKESGVPVEGYFWLVHHLRAGKVDRIDLYDDEAEALEAAGLAQ